MNWQRVNQREKCPVCGHDHWCWITPKRDAVLCMWQASEQPYTLSTGETGYFHRINGLAAPRPERPKPVEPAINVGKMLHQWQADTPPEALKTLSDDLGVSTYALKALGCAWAKPHRAWAFPMRDGFGNYTGIRLRTDDGHKFAVRGSHQGIFLPEIEPHRQAIICEGPTDTAAALSLGYYAIGRPNCSGGVQDIIHAIRRLGIRSAVIVADNDDRGMDGAAVLRRHLPCPGGILALPAKDFRKFVELGGTADFLEHLIANIVYENHQRTD